MDWNQKTSRSALSGVTGETVLYTVHTLTVPEKEDLVEALGEFWRVVLTQGLRYSTDRWEILLFEMWTDAGMITTVFTTKCRDYDSPTVFKLLSDWILREYESLPLLYDDLGAFQAGHERLYYYLRTLLERTATTGAISELIKEIRCTRSMPVVATLCSFREQMCELKI